MTDPRRRFLEALQLVQDDLELDAARLFSHNGIRGDQREVSLISKFLAPYLPKTLSLVKGAEILDSHGNSSGEVDISIVDPAIPPLYDSDHKQLLPIEGVFGCFEVKSKLDSRELEVAVRKIHAIKSLRKIAFQPQAGTVQSHVLRGNRAFDHFPTLGHIFAYESISLDTLRRELFELQKDMPDDLTVDGLFLLDKGMLVYGNASNGISLSKSPDYPYSATVIGTPTIATMAIMLQQVYVNAWSPKIKIFDYIEPFVSEIGRTAIYRNPQYQADGSLPPIAKP